MTSAAGARPGRAEPSVLVEMWADPVSPWCYVGKRRLEQAVGEFEHPALVLVEYRAFQLDPSAPVGAGGSALDQLAGGDDVARAAVADAVRAGTDDGLVFDLGRAVAANTFDAHRMIQLGRAQGGPALESAVLERLFSAHFAEGRPIDDHPTLQRLGAEAGLDERRLASVLAADDYADQVREQQATAARLGVRTVPFLLADRRHALDGEQSVDAVALLLQTAWDDVRPRT